MEATEDPWDQICPHCGAKMLREARRCWLCGGDVDAPALAGKPRPPGYRSLDDFVTATSLILVTLVILCVTIAAGFAAFAAVCTGIMSVGPR